MRPFKVYSAQDSREAVALLAEHAPSVKVLAGGTDLLADLKTSPHAPAVLVDITRAADLKGIAVSDTGLRIGAAVTHGEIMASRIIRQHFPALIEAAHTIGAVQTRNLGTLAGNLVTCVPSMDSGPALLALDATVTIAGPDATREIALGQLFVGPRKTCLRPEELVLDIRIPRRNFGKPMRFLKFGLRKGQALALVNVAAGFRIEDGRCIEPRIALGAVAPIVIRAPRAEASLVGRPLTPEAMAEAGRIAAGEAKPISDFRASAEYRRELIAVLTRRALAGALEYASAETVEQ